ncbi:glycoside hydrolase family 2 protein [Shewanella mangrovi]|uniref:glycoside hydrolase family 2 protein n=1 Tax=Shewanella mangrovi TaxID=1515746 RepID=UPI00068A5AF8|nr:glycoside hydrolase family 2 TIM barrel-domain containing protein [Shewanella mangrovi]
MSVLRLVAACVLVSALFISDAQATTSDRITLNFNTGWLYYPGDIANGQQAALSESRFTAVSLPHANKLMDKHADVDADAFRFVSWYRRHFALPERYQQKRVLLNFEGVATVADVFINGHHIQQHRGAYSEFTVDVTDYVRFGSAQDNLVAVRVDATKHSDIPPEGDKVDYMLFGGIVRDVNMLLTSPVYLNHSFVRATSLTQTKAEVAASSNIINTTGNPQSLTLRSELRDAAGQLVAENTQELQISAAPTTTTADLLSQITTPQLWDVDAPYLYHATLSLLQHGKLIDSEHSRLGLRSVKFAPDGFYLNQHKLPLIGLNRHEQWPWLGRAVPNRLQVRDADRLKYELGLNIVRLSHYPQDPAFLDRADEIGLLVLEELPGWQHIGDSAWQQLALNDLEAMILRDRNHSAIISWGVRINESADNHDFYQATNRLAQQLDPSRETHGVHTNENPDGEYLENGFYGYNDYNCWDGTHDLKPPRSMPWLITETNCKWKLVLPNASDAAWVEHMNEFARISNDALANPHILGAIGWSYVDYNTEVDYNNTHKNFYSGVYDLFRLPRFAAYFYQSQRDPARYGPMVKIASFWNQDSPDKVTIATNAEEVELWLNGKSLGVFTPNLYTQLPHPLLEVPVTFAAGELRAEARIHGQIVAVDSVYSANTASQLKLSVDDKQLQADGADLTRVIVEAQDKQGHWVASNHSEVTFALQGVGTLLGENPLKLENGRGIIFVQSDYLRTGAITVSSSAAGLKTDAVSLRSALPTATYVPLPSAQGQH